MKYKINEIVKGKVVGIEKYGVFIEVDKKINGLIHISEVSSDFISDLKDYFKIGEEIYVKVIGKKGRSNLKLSIKDIDYKEGKVNEVIKEAGEGFMPLYNKREEWIKDKLKEITKKKTV